MRPFWIRHPYLMRAFALLMMLVIPVLLPAIALWCDRRAVRDAFVSAYRDYWRLATEGDC